MLHLPSLLDDEFLAYAYQTAETALEKEFVCRAEVIFAEGKEKDATIESLEEDLEKTQDNVNELENELEGLNSKSDEMRAQISALEKALERAEKSSAEEIETLRARLAAYESGTASDCAKAAIKAGNQLIAEKYALLASLKELVSLAEIGDADLDEANWHPALESARAAILKAGG